MVIALALLAGALPCVILVAWTLERRERLQEIHDLRADQAIDRKAWQDERRELLNRIKPETAQYAAPSDVRPAPRIPFDDDEAFHNVVDPLAVSKEDLAEIDHRMDRLQRGVAPAVPLGGPEA